MLHMVTQADLRRLRELRLFMFASFAMGMGYSIVESIFNNFLNERFFLTGFERSFLEFPREIPGCLVSFVSAALFFLCSRRLGALSMALGLIGTLLIGFASKTYHIMIGWLFIYSLGQHLFIPLSSTIGMELADEGRVARRLGELNAIRNMAAIVGSFFVFVGFRSLGFTFSHTFLAASFTFLLAALLMMSMRPDRTHHPRVHLKLHRQYRLYYLLSILYGSRKQIFLTFGPWVLVTVFSQPTQMIAKLLTIGGIIGILFQPFLGWFIDRAGERITLLLEALLLIFVCAAYGLAKAIFPEKVAFLVTCICFLLDQMLMSVNMARSTYMRKIAVDPSHVQPALTASVAIDHVFSITVALVGGIVWNLFGYEYVFLMGSVIAAANFLAAWRVRIPLKGEGGNDERRTRKVKEVW